MVRHLMVRHSMVCHLMVRYFSKDTFRHYIVSARHFLTLYSVSKTLLESFRHYIATTGFFGSPILSTLHRYLAGTRMLSNRTAKWQGAVAVDHHVPRERSRARESSGRCKRQLDFSEAGSCEGVFKCRKEWARSQPMKVITQTLPTFSSCQ